MISIFFNSITIKLLPQVQFAYSFASHLSTPSRMITFFVAVHLLLFFSRLHNSRDIIALSLVSHPTFFYIYLPSPAVSHMIFTLTHSFIIIIKGSIAPVISLEWRKSKSSFSLSYNNLCKYNNREWKGDAIRISFSSHKNLSILLTSSHLYFCSWHHLKMKSNTLSYFSALNCN